MKTEDNAKRLKQTSLAREAKKLNDGRILERHRQVLDLLAGNKGDWLRQKAVGQIDLWERNNLCNPRYVTAWRHIMQLPVASIAAAILNDDDEGAALRQNSPLSHAMALVEGINVHQDVPHGLATP